MTEEKKAELLPLKPCPFCGREPLFSGSADGLEGMVECLEPNCPNDSGYDVEAWNTRTPDPKREAELAVVSAVQQFRNEGGIQHTWNCDSLITTSAQKTPPPCDCGSDAIFAALSALEAGGGSRD